LANESSSRACDLKRTELVIFCKLEDDRRESNLGDFDLVGIISEVGGD
jgi:hypothetical protein